MHKSRIAVLGGNGMLGHMVWTQLEEWGYEVFPSYRKDVSHASKHRNAFQFSVDDTHPNLEVIPQVDYIINCIGAIPQRQPTQPEMLYVNCALPMRLAEKYAGTGTRVIHVTTDCVFSGTRGWYNEDDEPDATDWYGTSKAAGESADVMNIRTSLIGPEHDSRGTNILEWAKKQRGKTVEGYTNHMWNGVTTRELAKALHKIIDEDLYETGTFHIYSPRALSKYEMLCAFNHCLQLDIEVIPRESNIVDRTLTSKFDLCKKLQIPSLELMLSELLS